MNIHTLSLGAYQTNTYILWQEGCGKCLVIDPGYDADTILDTVSRLGLSVEAILLTHGHFDHVGAVKDLAADTGCRVFLHPAETTLPPQITAGSLYFTDSYDEGDRLNLAGMCVSVLSTPGHTPGSVCLLVENNLFSGDTLFAGSCGRTDFPGGSHAQMLSSLRRLAQLEAELNVYPGHGFSTHLTREKQTNPYLR